MSKKPFLSLTPLFTSSITKFKESEKIIVAREEKLLSMKETGKKLALEISKKEAEMEISRDKNAENSINNSNKFLLEVNKLNNDILNAKYDLKKLNKKLNIMNLKWKMVDHEYKIVTEEFEDIEYNLSVVQQTKKSISNKNQEETQCNYSEDIDAIKKNLEEVDKNRNDVEKCIFTLEKRMETDKNIILVMKKTENFIKDQIKSINDKKKITKSSYKQRLNELQTSFYDNNKANARIEAQTAKNKSIRNNINRNSSLLLFIKHNIESENKNITEKQKNLFEMNAEAKTYIFKTQLVKKQNDKAISTNYYNKTENESEKLSKEEKKEIIKEHELDENALIEKIEDVNKKIKEANVVNRNMEEINRKLESIEESQKEFRLLKKQIKEVSNEYKINKNYVIKQMPIVVDNEKSKETIAKILRKINKIQNENKEYSLRVKKTLKKIKNIENNLHYIAQSIYTTTQEKTNTFEYNKNSLYDKQMYINELEEIVDKQTSVNAIRKEIINSKKDELYNNRDYSYNYNKSNDTFVFFDNSSITKYKNQLSKICEKSSFTKNVLSLEKFVYTIKKEIDDLNNNNIKVTESILEKWLRKLNQAINEIE